MKIKSLLIVTSIFLLACLATPTLPVKTPIVFTATAISPTTESTSAPTQISTGGSTIANCLMFPGDNFWNARVDTLPLHPQSDSWIDSIGRTESFHMDFGSGEYDGGPIGIPYNV